MSTMTSWHDFESIAPELAAHVRRRLEAHGLGLMATIRKDGSPRISGVEPFISDGELWIGMMPDSLKTRDLMHDPRFALHSATVDKEVRAGDAKLGGRLELVDDDETKTDFLTAFREANGYGPEEIDFPLFKADIVEASTVRTAEDHLAIEVWRTGRPVRRIERR
jgi:hypothetical protein